MSHICIRRTKEVCSPVPKNSWGSAHYAIDARFRWKSPGTLTPSKPKTLHCLLCTQMCAGRNDSRSRNTYGRGKSKAVVLCATDETYMG